ncbi:hypothetical protein [Roseisalinus antarcticus]|nr:hypothetical protein [Roseisalinus antarcticus]
MPGFGSGGSGGTIIAMDGVSVYLFDPTVRESGAPLGAGGGVHLCEAGFLGTKAEMDNDPGGDEAGDSGVPMPGPLVSNGGLVRAMKPIEDSPLTDAGSIGAGSSDGVDLDRDEDTTEARPVECALRLAS